MALGNEMCCVCLEALIIDSRYFSIGTGLTKMDDRMDNQGRVRREAHKILYFHPECFQQVAGKDYCQELAGEEYYTEARMANVVTKMEDEW